MFILIGKKQYLGTLALVSPKRNRRLRAQTLMFTTENQHVLIQMALRPLCRQTCQKSSAWSAEPTEDSRKASSSARSLLQPRVFRQECTVKCKCKTIWGHMLESFWIPDFQIPRFLDAGGRSLRSQLDPSPDASRDQTCHKELEAFAAI